MCVTIKKGRGGHYTRTAIAQRIPIHYIHKKTPKNPIPALRKDVCVCVCVHDTDTCEKHTYIQT